MPRDEVFGTDDQRALLRRGQAMAALMGDDPRANYYGRTVGLAMMDDGDLDQLIALAQLQGYANCAMVANKDVAGLSGALTDRGLVPMHYAKWAGQGAVLAAAQGVLDDLALPDDLHLVVLDGETPARTMRSLADMALGCGVLPPNGAVLRGLGKPAVCVAAIDGAQNVVSCAAASAFAHPNHPILGGQAWWGMLATAPDWRGRKLALILGAHAIVAMYKSHGFCDFMTGVEPGNAPSEAVCTRMGLSPAPFSIVGCADPALLGSGRMTK